MADYTNEEMHEFLLANADEAVMRGADGLVYEQVARWETRWPYHNTVSLVRIEDDATLIMVYPEDEDFSTTDEFWTEVES